MKTTLFPREEHTQALFREILKDPSACERLQDTFCESLNSNDEIEGVSAKEFGRSALPGLYQPGFVCISDDYLSEYYL